MVRYILTNTERELLKEYLDKNSVKNKNLLAVFKSRIKKLDITIINSDVELITRFLQKI